MKKLSSAEHAGGADLEMTPSGGGSNLKTVSEHDSEAEHHGQDETDQLADVWQVDHIGR